MRLQDIHISGTEAFIQGEQVHPFSDMKTLLERIGCKVTDHRVAVCRCGGVQTAQPMFNVEFPAGSRVIKAPRDRSSNYTAGGRRRKGAEKLTKIGWPLNSRKGQILVPGEESDYIVTYYGADFVSPSYFDRGVIEVEKN
jgi:hypothetical protein